MQLGRSTIEKNRDSGGQPVSVCSSAFRQRPRFKLVPSKGEAPNSFRIAWLGLLIGISLMTAMIWCLQSSSAQSGVLIPSTNTKPDPATLSLQQMNVDVLIDNQHARVRVLQIFDNHIAQQLEGKYLFALPLRASISDFAVWDGDTRIPGVMMEKLAELFDEKAPAPERAQPRRRRAA